MTEPASGSRRYLALYFPFLPAARRRIARRLSPDDGRPLAFLVKLKGALRIAAVDQRARALGLTPGLAFADARARVPELASEALDEGADAAWLTRLAEGCDRYTPMVALDLPDGLILDVTGCSHLLGGEAGLAGDIRTRLARLGMSVRAAFAGTPDAARALVRYGSDEGEDVRPLPVEALELDPEATTALRRAGLVTIGDLAIRPMAGLAARFGMAAATALRRLLGDETRPIDPRRAPPPVLVERRFAEPIARTEDALHAVGELVGEAAQELEKRGEGGRAFAATLFRCDGFAPRLTIETGRPSRDPALIVRLLRERIDSLADPLDPGFGYDMVRLAVLHSEPLAASQFEMAGEERPDADLAALVDRLAVRLGADRVIRLKPYDSHIPERAQVAVEAVAPASPWPASKGDEPPLRPLFLLDPPEPVQVVAEVPDGPPRRFRRHGAWHEVHRAEGPERIAAEWWRRRHGHRPGQGGLTRDYYRIEDKEGRRFWLFRHGLYGEKADPGWYLHGLFA
ncbi:Y-family DNA polymerase [Sphingosinicella sp.]|uniref:Y-family DNA polymerase n=1 Tax=Sphingosinicella sp. TaxID=1917971 RepID=UPI004037C58D